MKKYILILFLLAGCAHSRTKIETESNTETVEQTPELSGDNSQDKIEVEQEDTGDFKYYEGDVKVRDPEEEQWKEVDSQTELKEGSQVKLEENSYARVKINENVEVDLNEDTAVEVEEKEEKTSLEMFYGSLKAKTKDLTPGELEMKTPIAVLGVRGTEFELIYEEKEVSEAGVYSGEILVSGRDGDTGWEQVSVGRDTVVRLEKDSPPKIIDGIDEIRKLRWVHLDARSNISNNRRKVRNIESRMSRLKRAREIEGDPEKKEEIESRIDALANNLQVLNMAVAQNKINLDRIRDRYISMREEKVEARRKLLQEKRQEIIERRRERLRERREQRLEERDR